MLRIFTMLFAAVFLIAGCGSHDDGPPEATFAQMMIPHHEQAIVMADLALANNAGPEVSALAISIQSSQAPEIEQMRGILARYDVEEIHSHSGHDMPGMLTDTELDQLGRATGPTFDVLFLEGMIAHHQGAIVMAQDVLGASDDPEVRLLAEQIIREQEREITEMEALLGQQP